MDDTGIKINSKWLVSTLGVVVLIGLILFILNLVDTRKKYETFVEINKQVSESPEFNELRVHIGDFDTNNAANIQNIFNGLQTLAEIHGLEYYRLIIPYNNQFAIFDDDSYYSCRSDSRLFELKPSMRKEETRFVELSSQSNITEKELFKNFDHDEDISSGIVLDVEGRTTYLFFDYSYN